MSQAKNKNICLIILLIAFSFFTFGCRDKKAPVNDISFSLGNSEQIVLIEGEKLDLSNYIVVSPAYATNKTYTLTSLNEEIISIDRNTIKANSVGTAQVLVVSNDDNSKHDLMTIVVKKTTSTLNAPSGLRYNSATRHIEFDTVQYAVSYTLKINDQEIYLGNTNRFNLSNFEGETTDHVLAISVKANAPTYSSAFRDSFYSGVPKKIYQASGLSGVVVKGGEVLYQKENENLCTKVYLNDAPFAESIDGQPISLKNLHKNLAGQKISLRIYNSVPDSLKESGVLYYDSVSTLVDVNVLNIAKPTIKSTLLTWENVEHCKKYSVIIDDEPVAETEVNYFDLSQLDATENKITSGVEHKIKVQPVLDNEDFNTAATEGRNIIAVKKLEAVSGAACDSANQLVSWNSNTGENQYISAYGVVLDGEKFNELKTSTTLKQFDMEEYQGDNYTIKIQAIANEGVAGVIGEDEKFDLYYISSDFTEYTFKKHSQISARINDYNLEISSVLESNDEHILVDFDDSSITDEILNKNEQLLALGGYNFTKGQRKITLKVYGGENTIESNPFEIPFYQLGEITTAGISNGALSAGIDKMVEGGVISIVFNGTTIDFEDSSINYSFNTTDKSVENCLDAGDYTVKVYALGNGVNVFSWRNNNVDLFKEFSFSVLETPVISDINVDARAVSYSVSANARSYNEFVNGRAGSFDLTNLKSGETAEYSVQAIGDGTRYLDSKISEPAVVSRLEKPELKYDSINSVITKLDYDDSLVEKFVLKQDGNEVADMASVLDQTIELTASSEFTLQCIAKSDTDDDIYHLNSEIFALNLTKIKMAKEIKIVSDVDGYNELVVTAGSEDVNEHDLEVIFNFNGTEKTFKTSNNVLKCGEESLNYVYDSAEKTYTIPLVDLDNSKLLIEGLTREFNVKVKFIPKVATSKLIYSEYKELATSLTLVAISKTASITTNSDKIEIETSHTEQHPMVATINGVEFKSDGASLKSADKTLNFAFDSGKYIIEIKEADHDYLLDSFSAGSSVPVTVKFVLNISGSSIIDSDVVEQDIGVFAKAAISRSGQNIIINHNNVQTDADYSNFKIWLNGEEVDIPASATKNGNNISFDVERIYDEIAKANQYDEVTFQILVKSKPGSTNLTSKSDVFKMKKIDCVDLAFEKDNTKTDNTALLKFSRYSSDFNKQYTIYLSEVNETIDILDNTTTDGAITVDGNSVIIDLDEYLIKKSYAGSINATISVKLTGGDINYADNDVNYFNSNINTLEFEKVEAPENLTFASGVLSWDEVYNANYYEVYERETETSYKFIGKTDAGDNSYTFKNVASSENGKNYVVKAIADDQNGNYTNSTYSNFITILKPRNPILSTLNGDIVISLPGWDPSWLLIPNLKIKLDVKNNGVNKYQSMNSIEDNVEIDNTDADNIKLIANPELFLNYSNEIVEEKLKFSILFETSEGYSGTYFANPDVVEFSAYGLVKPHSVTKTSENLITWNRSVANKINGTDLVERYILKVEYTSLDGTKKPYYSTDNKLQYRNGSSFVSYSALIEGNSVAAPAAYDGVEFGNGHYAISVQAVPTGNITVNNPDSTTTQYNLCSSLFSTAYEFAILPAPTVSVQDGKIVWEEQEYAKEYSVLIDGINEIDNIKDNQYLFNNNESAGVHTIQVKAIGGDCVIDSVYSSALTVYRLPEVIDAKIEDGILKFTANRYFEKAIIRLIDSENNVREKEIGNGNKTTTTTFDGFDASSSTHEYSVDLSHIPNGDVKYQISITLVGNSNTGLGFITSKTKTFNLDSELGLYKLTFDLEQQESGVYLLKNEYSVNINYNNDDNFKNVYVYEVTLPDGNKINVIDYNCKDLLDESKFTITEYAGNGICGVKYDNIDNFTMFIDNIIDLKNKPKLYYYSGSDTLSYIDMSSEGVKQFNFVMLGGYSDNNNNVGYVSSNPKELAVVKYSNSTLSTHDGKLAFTDQRKYDEDGNLYDSPIYKVTINCRPDSGGATTEKTIYLYHSGTKVPDSIPTINRYEIEDVCYDDSHECKGYLYFDVANVFDTVTSNATLKINIQTLAGSGNSTLATGLTLINATETSSITSYHKPATVLNQSLENGYLKFEQIAVNDDGGKVYYTDYEITIRAIYNGSVRGSESYKISTDNIDVKLSNGFIYYILPNAIGSFRFDGFGGLPSAPSFDVNVKAVSKRNQYLNGVYKSSPIDIEKGKAFTSLEVSEGVLKWSEDSKVLIRVEGDFLKQNSSDVINDVVDIIVDSGRTYMFIDANIAYDSINGNKVFLISGEKYKISAFKIDVNGNSSLSKQITDVEREYSVEQSTIKLDGYGILEWGAVDGVSSYNVTIVSTTIPQGGESLNETFTVSGTTINIAKELNDRAKSLNTGYEYSVFVRANGTSKLHAMSTVSSGYKALRAPEGKPEMNNNILTWNAVEGADGYYVTLSDNGSNVLTDFVTECRSEIFKRYTGAGAFTITVQAWANHNKTLLSSPAEFKSDKSAPESVDSISYDENTFTLTVNLGTGKDWGDGDEVVIVCDFNGGDKTELKKFEWNELEGKTYVSHVLTAMGEYTNISVFVRRDGVVSSSKSLGRDISLDQFSSGSGTSEDPYVLTNKTHFGNIEMFLSACFKLGADIDISGLSEILVKGEFSGSLDGNAKSIYSTSELSLTDVESFALFEKLNGAQIKNLNIGKQENTLNLSYSFATNAPSVVKLSMLAVDAINSTTISNVQLVNCEMNILSNSAFAYNGELHVGGLFATIKNSTILGFYSSLAVEISNKISLSSNSYIAGVSAVSEYVSVNDEGSSGNIVFALTYSGSGIVNYAGGLFAHSIGDDETIQEISSAINCNAKVWRFGGIVGHIEDAIITSCTTSGTYAHNFVYGNITHGVGGVVGYAKNTSISNSNTTELTFTDISGVNYVGEIAGVLENCEIVNCQTNSNDSIQDSGTSSGTYNK